MNAELDRNGDGASADAEGGLESDAGVTGTQSAPKRRRRSDLGKVSTVLGLLCLGSVVVFCVVGICEGLPAAEAFPRTIPFLVVRGVFGVAVCVTPLALVLGIVATCQRSNQKFGVIGVAVNSVTIMLFFSFHKIGPWILRLLEG